MRAYVLLLITFLVAQLSFAQENIRYPIIPKPVKLVPKEGYFNVSSQTKIVVKDTDGQIQKAVGFLSETIKTLGGFELKQIATAKKNSIIFQQDQSIENEEGYQLKIDKKNVLLKYKTTKGAFLAIQTIRQLLPLQQDNSKKALQIPTVIIEDYPRFSYRGTMLDVARYYFPVDFIKKYIDLLAFYKINTFHIHLNDDQGWRIEIKKYPKLQEIGAWRKETLVGHRTDKPKIFDGKKHGGFYTQQELKDIVAYADARFITVIPEIDIPGHSQALLAAYPHLGCRDTTYQVSTDWGVHKEILCPKEETFQFLEDVFNEVIAIFPGKYIHIGGDEVPKDRWKESAFCQQLIKKLNLKDEHGLQSYFIQRVEKFLNSKGKAIIGWDEILEGGLAPNATVMSWRGEKGGIAAAKLGHNVIMSPNVFMYLDYYQTEGRRKTEPLANGNYLPLEKVYSYNPVSKGLSKEEAKYILGPQANLWTEYISTPEKAELMTFPRVCAMAEVGWTALERKDYNDFLNRLNTNVKYLEKRKVNFARYNLSK